MTSDMEIPGHRWDPDVAARFFAEHDHVADGIQASYGASLRQHVANAGEPGVPEDELALATLDIPWGEAPLFVLDKLEEGHPNYYELAVTRVKPETGEVIEDAEVGLGFVQDGVVILHNPDFSLEQIEALQRQALEQRQQGLIPRR